MLNQIGKHLWQEGASLIALGLSDVKIILMKTGVPLLLKLFLFKSCMLFSETEVHRAVLPCEGGWCSSLGIYLCVSCISPSYHTNQCQVELSQAPLFPGEECRAGPGGAVARAGTPVCIHFIIPEEGLNGTLVENHYDRVWSKAQLIEINGWLSKHDNSIHSN